MTAKDAPWAIVLAGGDGTRLEGITVDDQGRPAPKQYCRIGSDQSMIDKAFARAERVAPPERIIPVVAQAHEQWWSPALRKYPAENRLAQPLNRGTAVAILAALLHILRLEREPKIVILPSDHAVDDEGVLAKSFATALDNVARNPDLVVLLGMPPEGPEEGYGWIEPLAAPTGDPSPVATFVEKPLPGVATELMRRGALWNSFLVAAGGRCLFDLFRIAQPDLVRAFGSTVPEPADLFRIYARLPERDFCRHVLEQVPGRLRVIRVPPCGWIDLGSPTRVRRFLAARGVPHAPGRTPETGPEAAYAIKERGREREPVALPTAVG
jgi:mannose-1-phosphate guanylyltransferase